jgi:hypothetical protein
MSKILKFGEDVEGYNIPVLNEREVRASAGILFVFMFVAILNVVYTGDFTLLKYAVTIFLVDILTRVLISPRFAPSLIIGRLIVRRQTPEYVGAQQKKFAWYIGIALGSIMFVHLIVLNAGSIITGLICLFCLIFLLFESAFGICLGCLVYGWIKKDKAQYCPGEICEVKDRQEIQKTSWTQIFIVLAFVAFIIATVYFMNDTYKQVPGDLWEILGMSTPK